MAWFSALSSFSIQRHYDPFTAQHSTAQHSTAAVLCSAVQVEVGSGSANSETAALHSNFEFSTTTG